MNSRQFFDKVVLMRKYQREYFKYRRKSDLTASKHFESEIDEEIKRVNAILGVTDEPKPVQTLFPFAGE